MDKAQAIHAFWASYGWDAIDELSAYDEATMEALGIGDKYISYEVSTSNFGEPVALTASLWDRSTSWEEITQKADQIAADIGYGGKVLPIDGGYLWIKLGTPFAQRMSVDQNYDMRRITLNISVDFLTAV